MTETKTTQHPVVTGTYVRRILEGSEPWAEHGEISQVVSVETGIYTVKRSNGKYATWLQDFCEPCDMEERMKS